MKQRLFICELAEKGNNPKEIKKLLDKRYGQEALHQSSVYRLSALAKLGHYPGENKERPGRKPDEQLLTRIQEVLTEEPFASVRLIADLLNENSTIIYRYLILYLYRVYRCSRWIPHSLNDVQELNRVNNLKELYQILLQTKYNGFNGIITGDQSWFNFYNAADGAWIEEGDEPPEMVNDHISAQKIMIIIFWGINGFFIVDLLPIGQSYNSSYFVENILQLLFENKEIIWKESTKRKLWIQMKNMLNTALRKLHIRLIRRMLLHVTFIYLVSLKIN